MGKRIISQARGHGGPAYRVKKRAFIYRIKYPMHDGEAEILDIVHSTAHTAPLLKIKIADEIFFNPAFSGAFVGQKITINKQEVKDGNILTLSTVPTGSNVYNIEINPGD